MFFRFNRKNKLHLVGKTKGSSKGQRQLQLPASEIQLTHDQSDKGTAISSKTQEARERIQLGARANAVKVFQRMKNQFSDPNKCYRELVQNSMDAGTDRMYFEFNARPILRGEKIAEYLKFFQQYSLQPDVQQVFSTLSTLEELILEPNGEHQNLQRVLKAGYTAPLQEQLFLLREYESLDYLNLVQKEWGIKLAEDIGYDSLVQKKWGIKLAEDIGDDSARSVQANKIYIHINEEGLSPEIQTVIADPIEKMRYYDKMVELNMRTRREMKYQNLGEKSQWEKIVDKRYEYLQKIKDDLELKLEKMQNGEGESIKKSLEILTNLLAESPQKYRARIANEAAVVEKLPSTNFLNLLEYRTPQPRPFLEFLASCPQQLEIIAEDFGKGMTHDDREKFLKTIFATSKEGDRDQTGRFGVGFISVFALNPDNVIVQSSKDGQAWEYHFLKETENSIPGKLYVFDDGDSASKDEIPRQNGTKVSIILNNLPSSRVLDIKSAAKKAISAHCRHVEKPIYVDGIPINEEFTISSPLKVHFGKRGVEGIIGIVPKFKNRYTLENNRIVLEEKGASLHQHILPTYAAPGTDLGTEILVSSKYLNYDIARENVERDVNFQSIIRVIAGQEDNLAKEAFSIIEKDLQGDQLEPDATHLAWDFTKHYVTRKWKDVSDVRRYRKKINAFEESFPDDILQTKLAWTLQGEPWSLQQLLGYLKSSKELYFTPERTPLTDALTAKGISVFLDSTNSYRGQEQRSDLSIGSTLSTFSTFDSRWRRNDLRKDLLRIFTQCKDLREVYNSASINLEISAAEQEFLDFFTSRLEQTPLRKEFSRIVASSFEGESESQKNLPFTQIYGREGSLLYFHNSPIAKASSENNFFHKAKQYFISLWGSEGHGKTLAINLQHSYIKKVIRHEQIFHDGLGYNLLLQHLAQYANTQQYQLIQQLFEEEQQQIGKAARGLLR